MLGLFRFPIIFKIIFSVQISFLQQVLLLSSGIYHSYQNVGLVFSSIFFFLPLLRLPNGSLPYIEMKSEINSDSTSDGFLNFVSFQQTTSSLILENS